MRVAVVLSALAVAGATGCTGTLDPGDFGDFRYVGQVDGTPPIDLLPPTFDREGNIYIVGQDRMHLQWFGFVGSAGGYWTPFVGNAGTKISIGDPGANLPFPEDRFAVHGWVGHTFQNVYLWAGDQLFNMDGYNRVQFPYLTTDPFTQTQLFFRAVIPWIRETPSRTWLLAWIQSSTDPLPFSVTVDLRTGLYYNLHGFSPSKATDVTILGVGADKKNGNGVVLLRYAVGGTTHVEARFFDDQNNLVATAKLNFGADLPPFSIQGYLEANDSGIFAGLDSKGELITLNKNGGKIITSISGMKPVGVHYFEGNLFLVGTNGGPVVAPLDDSGNLGKATPWTASRTASSVLKSVITIIDDRRLPAHSTTWRAVNAMGAYPFVTQFNPEVYAEGETGWLVGGPQYNYMGNPRTAIAFAPVGISYP